jgi:hypothetical protein
MSIEKKDIGLTVTKKYMFSVGENKKKIYNKT